MNRELNGGNLIGINSIGVNPVSIPTGNGVQNPFGLPPTTLEYRDGFSLTALRFQRNVGLNWNKYLSYVNKVPIQFQYGAYALQGSCIMTQGTQGSTNQQNIIDCAPVGTKLVTAYAGWESSRDSKYVQRRMDIFSNDVANGFFFNYGFLLYKYY
jgi:hypothetical protein